MRYPRNTKVQFDSYLLDDDLGWVEKYYPDVEYERPAAGKVAPPRDAYTITIPEAAAILGITRAGAYKMAVERCEFESCRKVGPPEKPIYLLDLREVRRHARGTS